MAGKWWQERIVYQIYPRSFQDSNGDGVGDLQGIIKRLDYLKNLGIGTIWLNPIYDSPNDDMGYDIRDYKKIMREFGTMEDFDALLAEMHRRDIKLIMDLVVNHCSDEHRWFVRSRESKDNPYRDFFFWRDGSADGSEPNNWASFFTPSAWTHDGKTGQWYLHLFSPKQPDLNWENPQLREEVYSMINWWLDKGVDGFRMDVITCIAKNPRLPSCPGRGYVMGDRHFAMQPRLHDHLREMRRKCFDGRDCMCVGEASFVNSVNAGSLVGDGKELDMIFQFDLNDIDSENGKWNLRASSVPAASKIINRWQKAVEWNSLFLSNHDEPRPVSRWGCTDSPALWARSAKALGGAMHLLRGTSFIYQGEEIGMTNVPFSSRAELRDLESINYLNLASGEKDFNDRWKAVLAKGRDNARTPMQWSADRFGGFSCAEPWIMMNPDYRSINVASQENDPDSVLSFYKKLIRLKTKDTLFIDGSCKVLTVAHPQIFAYERKLGARAAVVMVNLSHSDAVIKAAVDGGEPWLADCIGRGCRVLLSNIDCELSKPELLLPFELRVCEISG